MVFIGSVMIYARMLSIHGNDGGFCGNFGTIGYPCIDRDSAIISWLFCDDFPSIDSNSAAVWC